MTTLFSKLSISHKLWGGFAIILALLAIVVVNTLFSLSDTKGKVDILANELQPTLIASMELMTELKDTASYLGFFLLTKEQSHKNNYHKHLAEIDVKLQALKDTPVAQKDNETQNILAQIDTLVARFKGYKTRMIQLTEDRTVNFASLGYATDNTNPINVEIVQLMSNMILSEADEEASEERKLLVTDIQDLRYTWSNVLNNIRVYVIFGDKDVLSNVQLFISGVISLNRTIATKYEGMLTFEQEESTAAFEETLPVYIKNMEKLIDLHQSDKACTNAYLIRTEIGPLLVQIDGLLNKLVTQLRKNTEAVSAELIEQTGSTTHFVTILLFIGLLVGSGIAWITTQIISKPLKIAVAAMKDIAEGEGDLTQRLNVHGNDEIAQLARGFNHFAANIQELLSQVLDSADQMSISSKDMATASSNAESSIQKQNSETEQISAAVEEISINATEIAQDAELATDKNS